MITQPLVSVILPVYNAERYISAAIQSILDQTYTNFELLLFNDGSTDSSLAIMQSFQDKRIRLFNQNKNIGLVANLNQGLTYAKGKYIARMDADDIAFPTRLTRQIAYLESHIDIAILGSWAKVIDETGIEQLSLFRTPTSSEALTTRLLFKTGFIHPTVVFRADAVQEFRYNADFFPAEDFHFWTLFKQYKLANLPEPLLYYRQHSASVHHSKQQQTRQQLQRLGQQQLDGFQISYSQEELQIHLRIGGGQYFPEPINKTFLSQCDIWFQKLQTHNLSAQFVTPIVFNAQLLDIWWEFCQSKINTLRLGQFYALWHSRNTKKLAIRLKARLFFQFLRTNRTLEAVLQWLKRRIK